MHDFVPLGSGNSRFLKTVNNAKTLYPTYDSFLNALVAGNLPIDLNGINAAGVAQMGTPLNKQNLLQDATAEALGLSTDASVNDALGKLSAAALYKVTQTPITLNDLAVGDTLTINETYDGATNPAAFIVVEKNYNNTGRVLVMRQKVFPKAQNWGTASMQYASVPYSSSIIDGFLTNDYYSYLDAEIQSAITAVNIAITPSANTTSTSNISRKVFLLSGTEFGATNDGSFNVEGKTLSYFANGGAYPSTDTLFTRSIKNTGTMMTVVCRASNGTWAYDVQQYGGGYFCPAFTLPADYMVRTELTHDFRTAMGDKVYVPGDQIVGGAKIETGSYTGTGNYGSSNQNSLSFSFEPKLVFVTGYAQSEKGTSLGYHTFVFVRQAGQQSLAVSHMSGYYTYQLTLIATWGDNSLAWYNSGATNGLHQFNGSGYTYNYVAIG